MNLRQTLQCCIVLYLPAQTGFHSTQLGTAEWISSLTQALSIAWFKGDPEMWFVTLRICPTLPTFQTSPSRGSAGIVFSTENFTFVIGYLECCVPVGMRICSVSDAADFSPSTLWSPLCLFALNPPQWDTHASKISLELNDWHMLALLSIYTVLSTGDKAHYFMAGKIWRKLTKVNKGTERLLCVEKKQVERTL